MPEIIALIILLFLAGCNMVERTTDVPTSLASSTDAETDAPAREPAATRTNVPIRAVPTAPALPMAMLTFTPTAPPAPIPAPTATAFLLPPKALENTPVPASSAVLSPAAALRVAALARFGKGSIEDVAYSMDGTLLAVASSLGVYLYSAQTLEPVYFYPTDAAASAVRFSPDGQTFAWGLADGRIEIHRAADGSLSQTLTNDAMRILALAYSEDGTRLVVIQDDLRDYEDGGKLQTWDLSKGALVSTRKIQNQEPFALVRQGQAIAVPDAAGANPAILFADVETGQQQERYTYTGYSNYLYFMAVSPDGKMLLIEDGENVLLWQVERPAPGMSLKGIPKSDERHKFFADECRAEADGPGGSVVESVAFSPDGQRFALGARAGVVQIRRVSDGAIQASFAGRADRIVFAPNGQSFVMLPGDGVIETRRSADGALLRRLSAHTTAFTSIAFSPDGRIFAAGASDERVRIWRLADGGRVMDLQTQASQVAFSPDGSTLATGSGQGEVTLWDLASGEKRALNEDRPGSGPLYRVNTLAFTSDGKRLVAGSQACFLQVWDAGSGLLERVMENGLSDGMGANDVVKSAILLPDGQEAASNFWTSLLFHDVSGNAPATLLKIPEPLYIRSIAVLPGGGRIAAGGSGSFQVWKLEPPGMVYAVEGPSLNLVASPDGGLLAASDEDGTIYLWRAEDGQRLAVLRGHRGAVEQLAFSGDGKYLASAAQDGTVILWGVE